MYERYQFFCTESSGSRNLQDGAVNHSVLDPFIYTHEKNISRFDNLTTPIYLCTKRPCSCPKSLLTCRSASKVRAWRPRCQGFPRFSIINPTTARTSANYPPTQTHHLSNTGTVDLIYTTAYLPSYKYFTTPASGRYYIVFFSRSQLTLIRQDDGRSVST